MHRIFIIGIVASGKTTLAKQLALKLETPWYELDSVVHHGIGINRYKRSSEEQYQVLNDMTQNKSWIVEGVYRESYHFLLDSADKIIFLDPPLRVRKIRILKRFAKQIFGIEKCNYKPDIKMLKWMFMWTKDFEVNREAFEKMLSNYSSKVIVLKSKESIKDICEVI